MKTLNNDHLTAFQWREKLFVLIALISCLALTGCRENYFAEKNFWKAEKTLKGITKAEFRSQGPSVLDPAIDNFKKVFEKYPSSPKAAESLYVISNLYIRQKKYEEAIASLEKIIQNYQNQAPEARNGIAAIHEALGNWQKAEQIYWETAEYHPFHQRGLYAPIHVLIHYKRLKNKVDAESAYAKALDHYRKMIKQTGAISITGVFENYLGLAHLSYGKWKEARQTWNAITDKYPDSPYAPIALLASGELSWRKKDYESAISTLKKFLELFPKHPLASKAQMQLGLNFQAQKKYEDSREWYNKALSFLPDTKDNTESRADILLLIGKSYQSEGLFSQADEIYQQLENKTPDSNAALQVPFLRAEYYEGTNQPEKVKNVLESAIKRYDQLKVVKDSQKSDYAMRLQNAAYAKKGDWQKVIENFDHMIGLETAEDKKGNWYFLKALVAEDRIKDLGLAKKMYEDFLTRFPNHSLANTAKNRIAGLNLSAPK